MQLLERTDELDTLTVLVDRAIAGEGRVGLIEGPPGIGKTELVRATRAVAEAREMAVLTARGGELEREFAFGVVRQLLEPSVATADEAERETLFAGAARLAEPVVGGVPEPVAGDHQGGDAFPVLHGLYWLVAGLAEQAPVLLAVDDAHWADAPSLNWLQYLSRRIEDLPILVVLGARSTLPEAPVEALEAIRSEAVTTSVRPEALSAGAGAVIVEQIFGEVPVPDFATACTVASGGNPFLLTELARAIATDGTAPDDAAAARIGDINAETIRSHSLVRLGQLPRAAHSLAVATAILGDDVDLQIAADLAGVNEADAVSAADTLAAAAFLEPGLPLRFQHPLIRSAVYNDLGEADRAARHGDAAHVLHEGGAPTEQVAAHLMLTEFPFGWAPDALARAAALAVDSGAPAVAVRYLTRALDLAPEERREEFVVALGMAEMRAFDPKAMDHLRDAAVSAVAAPERVAAIRALALTLIQLGRVHEAIQTLTDELDGGPADSEERLDIEADLAGVLHWGTDDAVVALDATLARVPSDLDGTSPAERSLLAIRAYRRVRMGQPADNAVTDACRSLELGLLDDQLPGSPIWAGALHTLIAADAPEARAWLDAAVDRATELGSTFGASLNSNLLAIQLYREGDLAEAEAFAAESVRIARDVGLEIGMPATLGILTDVLIERGRAEEAWSELVADGFDGALPDLVTSPMLLEPRGRLRLAMRRPGEGLADLLEAGEWFRRAGVVEPGVTNWRAHAAEAQVLLGNRDAARELAEASLEAARRFDRPRPIGIALRALGLALEGERSLETFEQAVDALGSSTGRLEHARALTDYGAALRRSNRRREAQEVLATAADAASRCGATALAERAMEETRATGARPRRLMLSGVESLTASELRVARLAADGLSNREIAQALFVTGKTVEKHLSSAYRKLEIESRNDLGNALSRG